MITRFQATGVSAGTVNWSYALRIPTTIPDSPSRITTGNRRRERPTARSKSPPGVPNSSTISGAASTNSAVNPVVKSRTSQKIVDATRQARARSPFSRSSLKTGTNAPESAVSATSARTRFGIWNATVNALILPAAPNVYAAIISRTSPSTRETRRGRAEHCGRPREATAVSALLVERGVERGIELGHSLGVS